MLYFLIFKLGIAGNLFSHIVVAWKYHSVEIVQEIWSSYCAICNMLHSLYSTLNYELLDWFIIRNCQTVFDVRKIWNSIFNCLWKYDIPSFPPYGYVWFYRKLNCRCSYRGAVLSLSTVMLSHILPCLYVWFKFIP